MRKRKVIPLLSRAFVNGLWLHINEETRYTKFAPKQLGRWFGILFISKERGGRMAMKECDNDAEEPPFGLILPTFGGMMFWGLTKMQVAYVSGHVLKV